MPRIPRCAWRRMVRSRCRRQTAPSPGEILAGCWSCCLVVRQRCDTGRDTDDHGHGTIPASTFPGFLRCRRIVRECSADAADSADGSTGDVAVATAPRVYEMEALLRSRDRLQTGLRQL